MDVIIQNIYNISTMIMTTMAWLVATCVEGKRVIFKKKYLIILGSYSNKVNYHINWNNSVWCLMP